MNNGVSKKLFITVVCVQAVVGLSDGADDKWPYALVVACIFAVYKIAQSILDWSSNGKIEKE